MGFLLTTALFTQHLWTLAIAIATFCLLKYPLSRATRYLDQFAWACWPVIWGVSALHSGRESYPCPRLIGSMVSILWFRI